MDEQAWANKYSRDVEFVDALPKTATGKLRRYALREYYFYAIELGWLFPGRVAINFLAPYESRQCLEVTDILGGNA